ncbi:MAG: AMP-binding protein [Chloroflexota bacterium]|nr:AMP-binding protein [Chloroflexota bacterium]
MRKTIEYPEVPFHVLLEQAARQWPDTPAIIFHDRSVTFGEWNRQTDRFAAGLHELGIQPGDRVALYTPNCPEFEIAFFGITRAGAAPTPLNPSYKEREVRHQLADSGAAAIVIHESLLPILLAVREQLPDLRSAIVVGTAAPAGARTFASFLEGQSNSPPKIAPAFDDLAALPYSSGTTGASKGVMLTQRNLVCNALQFVDATASTAGDTLLIFLPLYHIYGVSLMATAAASGARQVLLDRFHLEEVVSLIARQQITELYVVPPVMLALANAPGLRPEQFRSVRFIMSAAAPLSSEVAKRVSERLEVPVIQAYGMTETSPLTHMVPVERSSELLGSVGVVAADTHCRIVDIETGERELPVGEVGEVVVRGPQVMAGYWNAPEETAQTLRHGWIHTGDIGRVDAEGALSIVDRKKEMIKYKAFSIAPAELESILLEHPEIVDSGVTGQPDDEAGEVPKAYVVLRAGSQLSGDTIMQFVADRVAGYKQIRVVEIVDEIPRTPSGKILRRVLKERASGTP